MKSRDKIILLENVKNLGIPDIRSILEANQWLLKNKQIPAMKISPAALWHAKVLKIDPSLIRGSGPKGHILKSDILFAIQQPQIKKDFQVLIPCTLRDDLVSKGIKRALSLCHLQANNSSFSFQKIPEIGIQISVSSADNESANKLVKLLPILLQDPHYLLL